MEKNFTNLDKKIIKELQKPFPLVKEPFKKIAQKINISEKELLNKIREYKEKGVIRRFSAVLQHNKIGYKANALIVWQIPKNKIKRISKKLVNVSKISHCYERKTYPDWHYNLWTMIHAKTKKEIKIFVENFSKENKIKNYQLLFTVKEFKKTSPKYFMR